MNVHRDTILAIQMPLAEATKEVIRVFATGDTLAMEKTAFSWVICLVLV